ncbi:unnamed protein product, partial [Sphenostylis stenocarpa]
TAFVTGAAVIAPIVVAPVIAAPATALLSRRCRCRYRNQLVESLRNRIQNEGTMAYYLLLDNRFRVSSGYFGAEFQEST